MCSSVSLFYSRRISPSCLRGFCFCNCLCSSPKGLSPCNLRVSVSPWLRGDILLLVVAPLRCVSVVIFAFGLRLSCSAQISGIHLISPCLEYRAKSDNPEQVRRKNLDNQVRFCPEK